MRKSISKLEWIGLILLGIAFGVSSETTHHNIEYESKQQQIKERAHASKLFPQTDYIEANKFNSKPILYSLN
jgi:hypothetical protein